MASVVLAFTLLLVIILIGIIFDIIGIAAAAAKEAPFHAKAAKKIKGATQSLKIVRNADRVASFCNDVVGDIAGTLSGAIGAAIALKLIIIGNNEVGELVAGTVMAGFVAAITVGGKAWGKNFAIYQATEIISRVGLVLAVLESLLGLKLFNGIPKKGRRT
ncbi:MAG: hypothetical protein ACOY9Y_08265 [Bacillota bacterium]